MWKFKQSPSDNDNLKELRAKNQGKDSRTSLEKAVPKLEKNKLQPTQIISKTLLYKTTVHREILARMNLVESENLPTEKLKALIKNLCILIIDENDLPLNKIEKDLLTYELQNEILGLGPLEPLLVDSTISEIMVNRFDQIFVERAGKIELTEYRFSDDEHLLKIIDKIVTRVGRRVDELNPMTDARLPDGSRVNAIIPPVAIDGPAMSIRLFSAIPLQMNDLIKKDSITEEIAIFLDAAVKAQANILISGGTGSGKTTLLNILSGYIPEDERIITIEDTAELQLQQEHVVRLEYRPSNIEGRGEVSIRALVRNSLRMRPDRIVLGEVRGAEVIDMLQAMNTGHDGSLSTIHANTPRDALSRLENLIGMAGSSNIPAKNLREQIASAINFIVQIERLFDGTRKLVSIHEITGMESDVISTQEIFRFNQHTIKDGKVIGEFVATGVRPSFADKIKSYGITLGPNLFSPNRPLN
jgi:pilus assembly protein CpaF